MSSEAKNSQVITDNSGVEFSITPWRDSTQNYYRLEKIHLAEYSGGAPSKGSIVLTLLPKKGEESVSEILKFNSGEIYINDVQGTRLVIPYYVVGRRKEENRIYLEVVCGMSKDFHITPKSKTYLGITEAIVSSYQGSEYEKYPIYNDLPADSCVSDLDVQQVYESGYALCSRVCPAWRKGTLFAFGWDGLYLRDVESEDSVSDERKFILQGGKIYQDEDPVYQYSPNLEFTPEIVESTDETVTILQYNKTFVVAKSYSGFFENSIYNSRFTNDYTVSLGLTGDNMLPPFKIGDIILLNRVSGNKDVSPTSGAGWEKYIVKSLEIFFAIDNEFRDYKNRKFSFNARLVSFDSGEWSKN